MGELELHFRVNHQTIEMMSRDEVVADSVNYLRLKF
jgi:hypothetical protein